MSCSFAHAPARMIALAGIAVCAAQSLAAQSPPSPDTALLRRIFASAEFAGQPAGRTQWLDGDGYTVVERAEGGGSNIVRVDAATSRRDVLVSAEQLRPPAGAAPLTVEGYTFSPDRRRVLIFTNSERVWRQNTRGDYWVLDRTTGALRKLGGPKAQPSTLMFAKFSPDARRVAYVREGEIYVEPVAGATVTRLTSGASRTIVNGTSDWVYEEEFGLRDGFRWSPDGRSIAYWQFDMSGVRDFLLINDTDSLYSFTKAVQYPKAGQTNSAVRIGVVSAIGGPTRWVRLQGDPRQMYVPRMEWASSRELIVQHMDRRQQRDAVLLVDAATGAARTLFVESDSAWVDVNNGPDWIDGGRRFLWESERDGWNHVYAVSREGGAAQLLTPGAYDVLSVAGVDEEGGWLYVIASPDEPTRRGLYRVSLGEPSAPVRVSPSGPGTHTYTLSPSGRWAIHTWSTFDSPPVTDIVSLPAHTVARTLVDNARLRTAVAPIVGNGRTEFFRVPVNGGVTLDGWMIRPTTFDSTRRYPILVHVYGEPASQTVVDRWPGAQGLWHRAIADMGYVVLSVDPRGTPAPRGRAWRKVIYGAIGPLASEDVANAVRALTRSRRYLDSTRVGVWGWSGGGSSTLNAMFRHPDVFDVGMAVASVPDQRLYDSIYEERYVGLPQEHPERYRVSSPINFAEGLRGKLLIVHGTGDDNVHYQGAERLVNRLVALGKSFDFMAYPNRTHCICEGAGTTLHVYSLLTRYLTTNLPAGPR
ncbi:MAG TPA: S9 family peptidase [Gemmatimonadaceae bacterium]|nr:S9 family peptidase [Gemmatimonadaceae bacterium]